MFSSLFPKSLFLLVEPTPPFSVPLRIALPRITKNENDIPSSPIQVPAWVSAAIPNACQIYDADDMF